MINVAWISSYHIDCGIAQYVEHLEPELRKNNEINLKILPLPVDVSRAATKVARNITKQKYNDIKEELKECDVTIIEWEPGLYGITPFEIISRLKIILRASKKVLFVHHTVPNLSSSVKNWTINPWKIVRNIRSRYIFDKFFRLIRKNQKKYRHIVHTRRENLNFKLLGIDEKFIKVAPLSFLSTDKLNSLDEKRGEIYRDVLGRLNIEANANVKLVGCFGFLSPYKGIEVAVAALTKLPKDYHLILVGGLHPQAIVNNSIEQPYLTKLLTLIDKNKKIIGSRIHFLGSPDNEDFISLMYCCDAVVLPYAEVGQTSSGPAAMALDMDKEIYCSHIPCFSELNKFNPGILEMFEIGNSFELAEKLIKETGNSLKNIAARNKYREVYNLQNRAKLYMNLIKELAND